MEIQGWGQGRAIAAEFANQAESTDEVICAVTKRGKAERLFRAQQSGRWLYIMRSPLAADLHRIQVETRLCGSLLKGLAIYSW